MDQAQARDRSKKPHDAPQVCGFSLVCVLCKVLLLISESSEFRTLEKFLENLKIKKSENDQPGLFSFLIFQLPHTVTKNRCRKF